MGVDMGTYEELIAHRMTLDEIRDHVDADTLRFLSLEDDACYRSTERLLSGVLYRRIPDRSGCIAHQDGL
jgi:glutamine phosphoribosylpyrophosphate amidotransferase